MTCVEESVLSDGSLRLLLDIEPQQFVMVGFILESMEGFCIYTTIRRDGKQYLQIDSPPDFIQTVRGLLKEIEAHLEVDQIREYQRSICETEFSTRCKSFSRLSGFRK